METKNKIFDKTVNLTNDYRISKKDIFLRFYSLYPDICSHKYLKHFRYIAYPFKYFCNIYGLNLIKNNKFKLLEASIYGRKFNIRNTNSQFHSIYFKAFKECYEPDVSGTISIFLKPKGHFLDIGSNWGHHSITSLLNKDILVTCIEPNPTVYKDINRISKELNIDNKLSILNIALSDKDGVIDLNQIYFESGMASIKKNKFSIFDKLKPLNSIFNLKKIKFKVQLNKLDSLQIAKPSLIKIDAEGAELSILKGGIETIKSNKPAIIFEYHSGDANNFNDYKNLFDKIQYNIYIIEVNKLYRQSYKYSLLKISTIEKWRQYNLLALPESFDFTAISD